MEVKDEGENERLMLHRGEQNRDGLGSKGAHDVDYDTSAFPVVGRWRSLRNCLISMLRKQ